MVPGGGIQAGLVLLLVVASHIALHVVNANFGLTSRQPLPTIVVERLQNQRQIEKGSTPLAGTPLPTRHQLHPGEEGPFSSRRRDTCHLLQLSPRQRRMCRRDSGVAAALMEAVRLSVKACQALFQYDRWNCTLIDKYRTHMMRKGRGFREVSFLHALTAASITFTFSKACSSHTLDRCTCDDPEAWKWGGCGDNVPYAARFARRFLALKRRNEDIQANVDYHNILMGIRVVRKGRRRQCKCHGVSGSCSFKTCWHRVAPFWETAKRLKQMYQDAKKKQIGDNGSNHGAKILKYNGLAYTEKSPNFCTRTAFSPGISERYCNNTETCDEMCCGRGYNVHLVKVKERCLCRFTWCCKVKCETCEVRKEVYTCK